MRIEYILSKDSWKILSDEEGSVLLADTLLVLPQIAIILVSEPFLACAAPSDVALPRGNDKVEHSAWA